MSNISTLIGRVLLAHIFILAGLDKMGGKYAGTQSYMEAMGVPGMLLPLVILLELGGGLALAAGYKTKPVSWALAAFTIAAAVMFHGKLGEQMQMIMFMKNFAIAGGLLILAEHGAGFYSLERILGKK
ncbi:MAG: DoxX family protein [Gammaproteobacteria bacterium]|nr:DoxX family protein [Gammaproteobacteria bacterium]MDH5651736.1 DoxX family protein [Gammaproteobacteria bacterium]